MTEVIERLMQNRDPSIAKSYLVGLERGRIWAEDFADYFEIRRWSELRPEDIEGLPPEEEEHFRLMQSETALEWIPYLKGWMRGVREIREKY